MDRRPYLEDIPLEEASQRLYQALEQAGSLKPLSSESVSLEEALNLLALPRVVGDDPEGEQVTAQNGRYGPYLKKGSETRSLDSEEQIFTVSLQEALELFAQPGNGPGNSAEESSGGY